MNNINFICERSENQDEGKEKVKKQYSILKSCHLPRQQRYLYCIIGAKAQIQQNKEFNKS